MHTTVVIYTMRIYKHIVYLYMHISKLSVIITIKSILIVIIYIYIIILLPVASCVSGTLAAYMTGLSVSNISDFMASFSGSVRPALRAGLPDIV